MNDYREALGGALAQEYERARWRARRAQVRAAIKHEIGKHWLNRANRLLDARLDPARHQYLSMRIDYSVQRPAAAPARREPEPVRQEVGGAPIYENDEYAGIEL